MTYLLDTCVLSETRKQAPDGGVVAWLGTVQSDQLHVSVLTLGEIRNRVGRLRRKDPGRADLLETWLDELGTTFADRIVDVDAEIADLWGRLNVPDRLPSVDGLLAATAGVYGWTFVTRNVSDVARSGVALLNPFDDL